MTSSTDFAARYAASNGNGRTTTLGSIDGANYADDEHDDKGKNNVGNPPDKSMSWADSLDLDPPPHPPASSTNDDNPNWRDMVTDTVANVKIDTVENSVQRSASIDSGIFVGNNNPNEQGQYHM